MSGLGRAIGTGWRVSSTIAGLVLLLAMVVMSEIRARLAYRRGEAHGLDIARNAALDIAKACQQGDGTDAYEWGRHSGAMAVAEAITFKRYIDAR